MNVSRIVNYGKAFLNKRCQWVPFYSALKVKKLSENQSALFSSICYSHAAVETNKINLTNFNPLIVSTRGLKIRGELQLRCKDCYFVRKDGEYYVMCSSYPRHKQKAVSKREKYTWILTHSFQSKKRPY